jgi:serine/threonine protein kinase
VNIGDAAVDRLRHLMELPDTGDAGRYEILARIGEGGMGAVYAARDRELDREVALKVLRVPHASPDERERILREARILARLEHPGIVPVHDVGVLADGRVFYVMKRVRGEPLDQFARMERPLPELLRAFLAMCDAVAFAHAAGVVHRDLKPQNVMIGAFGEVLVLDWGVAKTSGAGAATNPHSGAAPAAGTLTQTGDVLGTPGYMAPEQTQGAAGRADARADVYGLGGVLWFLLARAHPTEDSDIASLRDVPRPLRAIVDRARMSDPALRYQTVRELAADIAQLLDGLPVSVYREGPLERTRRLVARHETAVLLVLGYLVMRVVLLVFGGL